MRILIVKLGAIGDVVHTLPAVAALRQTFPQARIAWAVERGGAAKLLEGTPVVDELIELNLRGWRKWRGWMVERRAPAEVARALARLRGGHFDLSLDFQGLLKSAMVARLAGVPRRLGFSRRSLREPAAALLMTELVPVDESGHIIEKHFGLVARLGVSRPPAYHFPITVSAGDEEFAARCEARAGGDFAILNPGGGWPTKLWAAENFATIADRLWQVYRMRSFITFGPGEEEMAQRITSASRSGAAEPLDSTLKEFYALARRARLFVGGDTGPMHIAAAARAPIVAIFGPTAPRRNGPFSPEDRVVERFDLDCREDCHRRRCSHTSCMKIPADPVWQAVAERLAAPPRRSTD